jgi:Fe-S-cluster-containing dehydrogenase component/DMSO reductase anchor subunit
MTASTQNFPLLAELLDDQQRLDTPAARFSTAHDGNMPRALVAAGRQLIPLTAPAPGEQYAFEVDLDSCTGCKSCVAACHSLNGLDEDETWRDVGLLVSGERRKPYTQTITAACHHCEDPACLNGCPVLAYEKDPLTGIVRHLDDQCIGCSYCVLKCPYDVPKYSGRLGIVRKCDMCHGRLQHGEAPACAQACPTQAIRIVTVPVGDAARPQSLLPSTAPSSYTRPTTRYVSRRGMPAHAVAADAAAVRIQPTHWPLVLLLTLMACAVGCSVAATLPLHPAMTNAVAFTGWVAGTAGLLLSVLHLGRPLRAWRIALGFRRSWLSREAIAFGAWFMVMSARIAHHLGLMPLTFAATRACDLAAAAIGIVGLMCSVMIYADTRREFWRVANAAPRVFGTGLILTLAAMLACCSESRADRNAVTVISLLLGAATLLKLALEASALLPLKGDRDAESPALSTARLLTGPLRATNELRIACGITGGVVLPILISTGTGALWLVWPALVLAAAGEILERTLFFRAVDAPKMPGMPVGR